MGGGLVLDRDTQPEMRHGPGEYHVYRKCIYSLLHPERCLWITEVVVEFLGSFGKPLICVVRSERNDRQYLVTPLVRYLFVVGIAHAGDEDAPWFFPAQRERDVFLDQFHLASPSKTLRGLAH